MSDPERFYVVSLPTLEHTERAYIECRQGKPNNTGPSAWYITADKSLAHDFGSLALARDFRSQLKDGEAYGLKNDGHVWQLSDVV